MLNSLCTVSKQQGICHFHLLASMFHIYRYLLDNGTKVYTTHNKYAMLHIANVLWILMAMAILILCSSPLFLLVLPCADSVLCFSTSAGSSGHQSPPPSSPGQMLTSISPPLHVKLINSYAPSFCKLFSSGKKCCFGALKGTHISVIRAGDWGRAAAAHAVQFRSCLVVPDFGMKSTKNL